MKRTRRRSHPPRHRSAGFTLLEILVAFVLLGLVGGSLLELFQGGMRTIALSDEYSRAALLARSKLAELQAQATLDEGEINGDFDADYRWQLTVRPYEGSELDPLPEVKGVAPMFVELDIIWGEGRDQRDFRLTTLGLSDTSKDRN